MAAGETMATRTTSADSRHGSRTATLSGAEAARANLSAATRSLATASVLGVIKLTAAIFTGSLAIVASFVDSVMDLVASSFNFFAVRLAGRPPDADHSYGHGKAEGLAGLAQAVVVGFSGVFLLVEGGRRLFAGFCIDHTDLGIAVMLLSTGASAWITWRLRATARKTGSLALSADAVHYASDVWTNGGVLIALVLIRLTGWEWIDGGVAMLAAVVVLSTAAHVLRRSTAELMDRALPEEELAELLDAVREEVPATRGLHDVRTRRAGPTVFIDCHVEFDRNLPFVEAHLLSERVRIAIQRVRPGAYVHVHADPHPLLPSDHEADQAQEDE